MKDSALMTYFDVLNKDSSVEERMIAADKFERMILQSSDRLGMQDTWRQNKKYVHPDYYCGWLKSWQN
jgi:hypothetical protein